MMALTFMLNLQTHERIEIYKKIGKFLANPNKISYKAAYIQSFCPYRAQGNNALIPRALPWARSFWAFSPCLNHMRKLNELLLKQASYTHV